MNKDLFGNVVEEPIDAAVEELNKYDTHSFNERLTRLKYINQIFPFGRRVYGSDESHRIFDEAIQCYIFGQYIATITLSQAFIERRIQEYFHLRFDNKRSNETLSNLLKEFKDTDFLNESFITRIDKLRQKRNPFLHRKEPLHENSLMARAFKEEIAPENLLEMDAKEAISLMLIIVQFRLL